ncbi:hypothetical protein [Mucilaginibacter sp.]|uniref:hypothetical protein n=1 Tax=Mucilaginibacter sp. TaxID=1882438 RepID=UPI003D0D1843
MKIKFLLLFFILFTNHAFAQSDWLILNLPMSNLLGKEVSDYHSGQIDLQMNGQYLTEFKIDTFATADDLQEYNSQYRSFLTKYFQRSKSTIQEVKAKKLLIQSLSPDAFLSMDVGSQYVYSGISADTVEITVSMKRDINVNYSKFIKDAAKLVTGSASSVVLPKVLALVDSVSSKSKDSVTYKMKVANPNVFYKVKIVKIGKPKTDWDRYYKCFYTKADAADGPTGEDITLTYDAMETANETFALYPEYGGKKRKDINFKLRAKVVNGDLKLFYVYTTGKVKNVENETEIPVAVENKQLYWKLNQSLIYSFPTNDGETTKLVYLTLRAEATGPNTIVVHNGVKGLPISYLKYPELNLVYPY